MTAVRRPFRHRPLPMRRVLVIGSGGAGKTTFATRLGALTGLPVTHLDAHFWNPGWIETPREEWARRVADLARPDAWIMDGNYGGTLDLRIESADTIVFLDIPRLTCLARVVRRRLTYAGRARPSLPDGCPERLSFGFLHWIWTYPARRRPGILERLDSLRGSKRVIHLRGVRAVRRFLADLE